MLDKEKYKVKGTIQLTDFNTKEVIEKSKKKLKKIRKKLSEIQDTMYAEGKYSMLNLLTRNGYFWQRQLN